jgi:chromosome segregation ATPase
MSKISELQEEFESLIKQLERLKSINDITSANSMKAEMTIDEIQKFIVATEKLLTAIKDDYEKKKKDFSSSEKALEAAVVKLNHGIAEQAEKFETITSSNSKIFVKELDILKKDWNTRVENYMHQIKDVKKKIETEVMDYSRSTTGQVRSLSQSIFEQLEDESKAKSKDIGVLRIKVDELNESIKR